MTRIFTEEGTSVPVTVIEVDPNRVTQIKNEETDGYRSIQVTFGRKRANLVNKPVAGHYGKAGVEAGEGLWELRLPAGEGEELETGAELNVEMFEAGERVDVTGTSKGKGFAGAVKRHGFAGGRRKRRTPGNRAGGVGCGRGERRGYTNRLHAAGSLHGECRSRRLGGQGGRCGHHGTGRIAESAAW